MTRYLSPQFKYTTFHVFTYLQNTLCSDTSVEVLGQSSHFPLFCFKLDFKRETTAKSRIKKWDFYFGTSGCVSK